MARVRSTWRGRFLAIAALLQAGAALFFALDGDLCSAEPARQRADSGMAAFLREPPPIAETVPSCTNDADDDLDHLPAAERFYRGRCFAKAELHFRAELRVHPTSIPAEVGIAKTRLARGYARDAHEVFSRLRANAPGDAALAYWMARTFEGLDEHELAKRDYEAILLLGDAEAAAAASVALARLVAGQEGARSKLAEIASSSSLPRDKRGLLSEESRRRPARRVKPL